MSTEQPSLAPEKNDEDRILQIEEDLHALHWHIANMEERLCGIMTRLKTAKLHT